MTSRNACYCLVFRFGRNCQESYRQYTIGCQCLCPMRGKKKPAICYIFRPLCLHSKERFKAVGHSHCRLASLYTCRCRDSALERWKETNQQDFCVRHATSENSDHMLSLKQSEDKSTKNWITSDWRWEGYQEEPQGEASDTNVPTPKLEIQISWLWQEWPLSSVSEMHKRVSIFHLLKRKQAN